MSQQPRYSVGGFPDAVVIRGRHDRKRYLSLLQADPAYSVTRLELMDELSEVLANFQSVELTMPTVLQIARQIFPLASAVLIERRRETSRVNVWHSYGTQSAMTNQHKALAAYSEFCKNHNLEPSGPDAEPVFSELPGYGSSDVQAPRQFVFLPLGREKCTLLGALQLEVGRSVTELDLAFMDVLAARLKAALKRRYDSPEQLRPREIQLACEQELRKRAEAANFELARSNADLQQFAYVASHDLKEPLRMIHAYLTLIERDLGDKLDTRNSAFFNFARDGATRMRDLIDDLLEYAGIGARNDSDELADCNEVVRSVLTELDEPIRASHASITYSKLPTVRASKSEMALLFLNLLGNALKFRRESPPEIQIEASLKHQEWLFSVRDNGIGMEEKSLARIFVIFQRLHAAHEFSGTGIGLAICKKIIERHGGRIWAHSTPGQGSTICFSLPSEEACSEPLTEEPPSLASNR